MENDKILKGKGSKPIKDLTGMVFGRWKVLRFVERKNKVTYWECECQCEKRTIKDVDGNSLKRGKTQSCGCLKSEKQIEHNKINKRKYNTYNLTGEYGIGYTEKNEEFYFDLEDYNKIKYYCWCKHYKGYIYTNINQKYQSMHRYILNYTEDDVIDHKNRVKHDNRKENLKVCEQIINMKNQNVRCNNVSGVVGVTWSKQHEKWQSYIAINRKNVHLGFFINKEDAIIARLKAEKKHNYSGKNKELWEQYNI